MAFDKPRTKALAKFIKVNAEKLKGLSIEPDGVFIYTDSSQWCDDCGSGTFSGQSEVGAIRAFNSRARAAGLQGD